MNGYLFGNFYGSSSCMRFYIFAYNDVRTFGASCFRSVVGLIYNELHVYDVMTVSM